MALTLTLTDGTTSIPLVYNAANTYDIRARYGGDLRGGGKRLMWHEPDQARPELVDAIQELGEAAFNLDIRETTIDGAHNAVIETQRLLDQAEQYELEGRQFATVARVYLNVRRNNATNTTQYTVIRGDVDDSRQFDSFSHLNDIITGANIRLTLNPVGQASQAYVLSNYVVNGDFSYEGATAGLAAGWTTTGAPTYTLETGDGDWIIGGKGQRVVGGAADAGLVSTVVAAPGSGNVDCAGYAWVTVVSGTVRVQIRDTTAASTVVSANIDATDSGAVSDKTLTIAGTTWRRVKLQGTFTLGNNHQFQVVANGAAATWIMDAVYMYFGDDTMPPAWMSDRNIDNRADRTTTNHTRINHVDLALLEGDAPAEVLYTIASSSARRAVFGHYTEGRHTLGGGHWVETLSGSGTAWATSTGSSFGANYTGANWYSYVDNDTESTAIISGSFAGSAGDLEYINTNVWEVYAVVGVSNTAITVTPRIISGVTLTYGAVSVAGTAAWYAIPLAVWNPATITKQFSQWGVTDGYNTFQVQLSFDVSGGTYGANCIGVDAIFLMPLTDGKATADFGTSASTFHLGGEGGNITAGSTYTAVRDSLTDMWKIRPGRRRNRMIHLLYTGTARSYDSTEESVVTCYVLPQTRHLFGTL